MQHRPRGDHRGGVNEAEEAEGALAEQQALVEREPVMGLANSHQASPSGSCRSASPTNAPLSGSSFAVHRRPTRRVVTTSVTAATTSSAQRVAE